MSVSLFVSFLPLCKRGQHEAIVHLHDYSHVSSVFVVATPWTALWLSHSNVNRLCVYLTTRTPRWAGAVRTARLWWRAQCTLCAPKLQPDCQENSDSQFFREPVLWYVGITMRCYRFKTLSLILFTFGNFCSKLACLGEQNFYKGIFRERRTSWISAVTRARIYYTLLLSFLFTHLCVVRCFLVLVSRIESPRENVRRHQTPWLASLCQCQIWLHRLIRWCYLFGLPIRV